MLFSSARRSISSRKLEGTDELAVRLRADGPVCNKTLLTSLLQTSVHIAEPVLTTTYNFCLPGQFFRRVTAG